MYTYKYKKLSIVRKHVIVGVEISNKIAKAIKVSINDSAIDNTPPTIGIIYKAIATTKAAIPHPAFIFENPTTKAIIRHSKLTKPKLASAKLYAAIASAKS